MSGGVCPYNVALPDEHYLLRGFAKLDFAIRSEEKSIVNAVATVRGLMELLGFAEDWIDRAELCFQEALLNAHFHGNGSDGSKEICIRCMLSDSKVELQIEDEGYGFDLKSQIRQPHLSLSHGRGLYLISELMDTVAVNGSHIVMGLCKE